MGVKMYRKKNALEKSKDVENSAIAAREEHRAVAEILSEATDYGPAGFARIGGLYFVKLEDAHGAACMIYRQAEETHVGKGRGIEGKWDHTTHANVYEGKQ